MNGEVQITSIPSEDKDYPIRLAAMLRSVPLYVIGNKELLGKKAVGICGSRSASDRALQYAYEFGIEAAKQGIVVVSGYARGIDRQAHMGALHAGGATIAVLPQGIQHFRLIGDFRDASLSPDFRSKFLVVSMFERNASWVPWRAMKRNKLIVGLSIAMFVVEAQAKGGTMNAAEECLRQKKPLWVVDYAPDGVGREGSHFLLQGDANPIKEIDDFSDAVKKAASATGETAFQPLLIP